MVRKLLVEDVSQITWLAPAASGGDESPGSFIPEVLPENVFRPLTDWVDYVLDRDREKLQAWVQAMQFEFEPFICAEDERSKPKKPPDSENTRGRKTAPSRRNWEATGGEKSAFETTAGSMPDDFLEEFSNVEKMEPRIRKSARRRREVSRAAGRVGRRVASGLVAALAVCDGGA